ncbi:MAG: hypothetical protein M3217_12935, partial [Actinomycetota bacterium]|nr:hypothetical protein [Actinomycetota bacterium]
MGQPSATIYFRPAGEGGGSSSAPSHGPYASDFGHVLLVITHADGTTTAFDYWGEGERGVVNPNVDANRLAELPIRETWTITPEQDRDMTRAIEALRANPPNYALPPG